MISFHHYTIIILALFTITIIIITPWLCIMKTGRCRRVRRPGRRESGAQRPLRRLFRLWSCVRFFFFFFLSFFSFFFFFSFSFSYLWLWLRLWLWWLLSLSKRSPGPSVYYYYYIIIIIIIIIVVTIQALAWSILSNMRMRHFLKLRISSSVSSSHATIDTHACPHVLIFNYHYHYHYHYYQYGHSYIPIVNMSTCPRRTPPSTRTPALMH